MFYTKREKFNRLSVKIGKAFNSLGLSPNQWTFLSLVFIVVSFYYLVNESFFPAALFFLFSAFVDVIDGSVARVTGNVTKKGAYFDTVIDRYVEFVIIFGLLFSNLPNFILPIQAWLMLLLFGSLLTTYVKSAAFEKKLVKDELKGGILERAERLILLFLIVLLAGISKIYSVYLIVITAILANISALQRIGSVLKR